ncbi:MAG: ROK family protein [Deltaproteobacteria bacterium]|nr:ROK family protein [Deltaproteobacteria bacterium]MBN2674303.1 ROK family protein [Deltaproteobacteria bacterium]
MSDLFVGIDMGGTKIEAVAVSFSPKLQIHERTRIPTNAHQGYDALVDTLSAFITDFCKKFPAVSRVGIGMPGSTRADGAVKNANTECLNGRFFHREVQERVSPKLFFANDANCFALAEAVLGAGKGHKVVFGVIMGTGVGGGLVINGAVREGPHSICGEWGHTSLWPDSNTPCYCGKTGCVEQFIAGPAIERHYRELGGEPIGLKEIVARDQSGESVAVTCIDTMLDNYGRALSNLINILDPDAVVLGGGVSNVSALYSRGYRKVAEYLFSENLRTPILQHELGDSAGVLGAALLCRS